MFVKGQPSKPGPGRPKGAENQKTKEARALAKRMVTDPTYQKNLLRRLRAGEAGGIEVRLWEYGFGKPKEALDLNFNFSQLSDEELKQLDTLVKRIS